MSRAGGFKGNRQALPSKPCVACGQCMRRMSGGSLCKACRHDPAGRAGARACPFTPLSWSFLMRHEAVFAQHPRLVMQLGSLARLTDAQKTAISERAQAIRRGEVDAA